MNFEFAKYTEITDYALKHNPEYEKNGYIRFFICPDVNDFWLVRIMKDTNEQYEREEGCFLMERDKIQKDEKGQNLSLRKLKQIIENDEMENWDVKESFDLQDLIKDIDDGFGILNLKEESEKV